MYFRWCITMMLRYYDILILRYDIMMMYFCNFEVGNLFQFDSASTLLRVTKSSHANTAVANCS